jgi:hypothetical protein
LMKAPPLTMNLWLEKMKNAETALPENQVLVPDDLEFRERREVRNRGKAGRRQFAARPFFERR